MKTKLNILIAMAFAIVALTLTSCNSTEPDTHMGVAMWTVYDAKYDKDAETVTRAYAELLVSGYHTQPYGLSYTIDGKAGTGELAIHRLPKGDNGADIKGGDFKGNCPSGTPMEIDCYKVNNKTEQYHGLARFLMPKLEPGTHVFEVTVTNEYGESLTSTKTFSVEGE